MYLIKQTAQELLVIALSKDGTELDECAADFLM